MKTKSALAAVLFCSAAAAAPVCQWDFDKFDASKRNIISSCGKYRISAMGSVPGFKGNGLHVDSDRRVGLYFPVAADWKNFTFEVKFKLDKGVNSSRGNTLICYGKHSWNRSQFVLKITPKSQLQARFTQNARKEEFILTSKILKFEPGRFYTVRTASQDGGSLKIWVNGELVGVKETGSWGFNRLIRKSPPGYPLLILGSDLASITTVYRALDGVVDDFKIWNSFEEPDLISDVSAAAEEDVLLITENESVSTKKFTVLDRPGTALGSFIRPEQKFLDAAASARVTLTPETLVVLVTAPIAAGTALHLKSGASWNGDLIEFFFRPDPAKGDYFQYAANVSGFKAAFAYTPSGTLKENFKSVSSIRSRIFPDRWEAEFIIPRSELGLAGNIEGWISSANFTRTGKTGGGKSTWAPVGNSFHTPSCFRQVVFGSYKSALLRKLAASRAEFHTIIEGKEELRKTISAELDIIEKRINSDGDRPGFFTALSQAVDRMALRYTQLKFSGMASLLWQHEQPWGNDVHVSPLSQPLKKISLVLPQNSFTFKGFVFSNLSRRSFLGQIKCFTAKRFKAGKVYNNFNERLKKDDSPIYQNVKFYEALPLEASGVIYDPLLPLPMNTLLRAGADESKQIWMRVSSRGLPVGKHEFVMVLKPSYTGFTPIEIPVEIEVKAIDLKTIKPDSFHYTYINSQAPCKELLEFLAAREINVIYSGAAFGQERMNVYPQADKNGNILRYADYSIWDNLIESKIRAGIERKRIKLLCYLELPTYGMHRNGNSLRFNSPEWRKAFESFLFHFTGYMEKKHGITKDRIFFYTIDEPDGDINKPSSRMYKAYLSGKIIKEMSKEFRTMVNPHPNYLRDKDFSAFKKLAEVYDVFELYRPALKGAQLAAAQKLNREIWTYGIYHKTTVPEVYRQDYWQNLRDGFSSMISYWHLDEHSGGDGFNSEDGVRSRADYGSIFVDKDMGTVITSRREEAHALGLEDYKLAEFCRRILKKKPDPKMQKELDAIISRGASADMNGMEQCRLQLLKLAEQLSGSSPR